VGRGDGMTDGIGTFKRGIAVLDGEGIGALKPGIAAGNGEGIGMPVSPVAGTGAGARIDTDEGTSVGIGTLTPKEQHKQFLVND